MVNFGEKDKIKKAGNLNQGHSYVTTTVSRKFGLLSEHLKDLFKMNLKNCIWRYKNVSKFEFKT